MANLNWCCKQKDGIKLVEPNENLAKEYLKSAEETLLSLKNSSEDSNMWKATKKYYAEYLAVYALLMKIGIKCEIHDCTIELIKFLENLDLFPKNTYQKLVRDKNLRIDNQYYLKNIAVSIDYTKLFDFILNLKEKVNSINFKDIERIRKKITELMDLERIK